jgi:hypothetical protein
MAKNVNEFVAKVGNIEKGEGIMDSVHKEKILE